jgi:hypothetical protein
MAAGEVRLYLNHPRKKRFRVRWPRLQDPDNAQQIKSAIRAGRSAQHGLQLLFRALLISGGKEFRSMTQPGAGYILG